MDLVFIYLSITVCIFVLVLTVSSLLPPTVSLQLLPVTHPASGLCLCSKNCCWGERARKDVLLGMGTCAQVALLGYDS